MLPQICEDSLALNSLAAANLLTGRAVACLLVGGLVGASTAHRTLFDNDSAGIRVLFMSATATAVSPTCRNVRWLVFAVHTSES